MKTNRDILIKEPSRRRYIIAGIILLSSVLVGYIYFTFIWKSASQKAGEAIIRRAAARIIDKKPERLTRSDLAEITELYLNDPEIPDITFLRKFTNLRTLSLLTADLTKPASSPKLVAILKKLHLYKKPDKTFVDISILEELPNLEILTLTGPVSSFNSVGKLKNLKELNIVNNVYLPDLEPIKELQQLQKLGLTALAPLSLEPIGKLSNLQELKITDVTFFKLEPLSELVSLKKLIIERFIAGNTLFETFRNLKNLRELTISYYGLMYQSGYGSGYGSLYNSGYGSGYGGIYLNLESLKELPNLKKLKLKILGYSGYYGSGYGSAYGSGYGYSHGFDNNMLIQIQNLQKALPDLEIEW